MPFIIVIVLIVVGLTSASEKLGISVPQLLVAIGFGGLLCILIARKLRLDAKKQAFTQRRSALVAKYGNVPLVDELMACSVLKGMSFDELVDSIGTPVDEDHKVLKSRIRRTLKYGQTGVNRFDLRVIVENDVVVGWQTQQPIGTANGFRPVLAGLPGAAYGNDVGIMQRSAPGPLAWGICCVIGVAAFVSAGTVGAPDNGSASVAALQQPPSPSSTTTGPLPTASSEVAPSAPPTSSPTKSFEAGKDARIAFETWVKDLSPQQRKGALWWASERSKKTPHSCGGSGEFAVGCSEAKVRLDESDRQRTADPEFRRGWNSVNSG